MGELKTKIIYALSGAVIGGIFVGSFWIGDKIREILDSSIQRYDCYADESVPSEKYGFLHDNDSISISVTGNNEDNEVLISAAERAVENVNNYIELNDINLPQLRIISEQEAQIRIQDIETYVNEAHIDGFDREELSGISTIGSLPNYNAYAFTDFDYLYNGFFNHDLVGHHADIVIRNYSIITTIPNGPIITPYFLDNHGRVEQFIISDLGGNILCINVSIDASDTADLSSLSSDYTECTDEDRFNVYSRTIEHEIMHALGVETHDCSASSSEPLDGGEPLDIHQTGYSGINIMSRPYSIRLENNDDTFRIFVFEYDSFSAERLIEVHGTR